MISIVVATYNRKEALLACIEHIRVQTHADFELIIVDDGSTDGTGDMVKAIDDERIVYMCNEKNMGAVVSRNKGLDRVKGEYMIVWDSDDFLYPKALEVLLAGFITYPDAVTISAPTRVYAGGKEVVYEPLAPGRFNFEAIVCGDYVKYKLARLSRVSQAGRARYPGRNLDFMFNTYLAECGPWYQLTEFVGDHFLESDGVSLTTNRRKPNIAYSIERADPIDQYLTKFKHIMTVCCPGKYAAHSYGAALGFLLAGKVRKARFYARQAYVYSKTPKHVALVALSYTPGAPALLAHLFNIRRAHLSKVS